MMNPMMNQNRSQSRSLSEERSTILLMQILALDGDNVAQKRFAEELARRYFPRVRDICICRGMQESDAEDIAIRVLTEVFLSPERFDPERGRYRSWVIWITHRRILDHLRRDARDQFRSPHSNINESPQKGRVLNIFVRKSAPIQGEEDQRSAIDGIDIDNTEYWLAMEVFLEAERIVQEKENEKQWACYFKIKREYQSPKEVAKELGLTELSCKAYAKQIAKKVKSEFLRLSEEIDQISE